jgi:hypothetical protein
MTAGPNMRRWPRLPQGLIALMMPRHVLRLKKTHGGV